MTETLLPGRATAEGTRRYAARFAERPGHFREPDRLALSSLGLGTRNGAPGGGDDFAYREAILRALELGVNVFDTALSYRLQTSERVLGATLARAFAEGRAARDEIVVVTKGGYLVGDPDFARSRGELHDYLVRTYLDTELIDPDELVAGQHSLDPPFLADQIERSRRNLGLATLDVYCLQDPELHLQAKGPDAFRKLLVAAFELLEDAVAKGAIAAYGVSTWSGLLVPHTERGHVSAYELLQTALEVGGPDHHLRMIQLPYSVAMAEALGAESQVAGPDGAAPVLEMLRDTGTAVVGTAPLVQGRAVRGFPDFLSRAMPELATDAQRALQFARSAPGLTTALVGMRRLEHVEENLAVTRIPPLSLDVIEGLFAAVR